MVEQIYHLVLCINISKTVQDSPKLLVMTNRKLCARFQLASRSMTLDDLELQLVRISRDFADFGGDNATRIGRPAMSATEL